MESRLISLRLSHTSDSGHAFMVGNSVTTGATDVVIFGGIHLKVLRFHAWSAGSLFASFLDM